MAEEKKEYTLILTGDVGVHREDPDSMFRGVKDELAKADLLFGQLEAPYSRRGSPLPQGRLPVRANPDCAPSIKKAGYDVMSFAGNHTMDWGVDAFNDTLDLMKSLDIKLIGAGRNIGEARMPVIWTLEDGTKIGFLGYSSICPQDYWANKDHGGLAPMRGLTVAHPDEHDQPETSVSLFSFPYPPDLEAMLDDIRKLRPQVDILILSVHWGIHFTPSAVGYYQKYYARFAIHEGVDLVFGHHAHIMKPIEIYRGVPIIYSMPNFALEGPQSFTDVPLHLREGHDILARRNPETAKDPSKQMPEDSYKSYFLKCTVADKKIQKFAMVPCQLSVEDFHPEVLKAEDPRFGKVIDYMRQITADQKFNTTFTIEGNEAVIM